jgi:hypothetical protein
LLNKIPVRQPHGKRHCRDQAPNGRTPLRLAQFQNGKCGKVAYFVFHFNDNKTPARLWSLTLREEHRLRASENRVLRGTFGPEGGRSRELHSDELHNLRSSPNVVRVNKLMGSPSHLGHIRQIRNAYRIMTGISESKRILVNPEEDGDNIKMDLIRTGCLTWRSIICSGGLLWI